jgi:cobalt/nickel transport system permease protein
VSQLHTHTLYVHGHSPAHRLPSHVKVAALLVFLLGVVSTPREVFWAFGAHAAVLAIAARTAQLTVPFMLRRMLVEVPFVLFAAFLPFLGPDPRVEVLGISLSQEGLWGAWSILARATLGTGAAVLLAATTEVPDILTGLSRLKVPAVLVAIAGFMVRYLDVLADELGRMRTAAAVRGFRQRGRGALRALASVAGSLFIRAYERGERIHAAMVVRGYRGVMPQPFASAAVAADWTRGLALPLVGVTVAVLAVVL